MFCVCVFCLCFFGGFHVCVLLAAAFNYGFALWFCLVWLTRGRLRFGDLFSIGVSWFGFAILVVWCFGVVFLNLLYCCVLYSVV